MLEEFEGKLAEHGRLKKMIFQDLVSSISSAAVVPCILTPNHSCSTRVL